RGAVRRCGRSRRAGVRKAPRLRPGGLYGARSIPYIFAQLKTGLAMTAEPAPPVEGTPLIKPSTTGHPLYESVVEACRTVYDPEIPVNIFDLGLIYSIVISPEKGGSIVLALAAPGCPVAGEMPGCVADAVAPIDGVKQVDAEMTFEPQWGMDTMSAAARLELGFM